MLLLRWHLLGHPRAVSKLTRAVSNLSKTVVKVTTKVVTCVTTKATKVGVKGDIKARERATKVAINRMTMVRRVGVK